VAPLPAALAVVVDHEEAGLAEPRGNVRDGELADIHGSNISTEASASSLAVQRGARCSAALQVGGEQLRRQRPHLAARVDRSGAGLVHRLDQRGEEPARLGERRQGRALREGALQQAQALELRLPCARSTESPWLVYPGAEREFSELLDKIDRGEPIAI
jgi:hypothetical protein